MSSSNEELLSLARDIAAEAAQLIAGYARTGFEIGTKSSRTDMVTEADRAAEALIVKRVLEARPGDGLLGEEGASLEGSSGVRWVIDPLDGTTNFIYGIPAYAVSIGVERDGEVVAAVVHDVAHAIAYTATLGGGAQRNGQPIAISGNLDLGTCLFGTGFAYDPIRRAEQAAFQALTLPHIRDVRRMGSAALDLCSVACGMLDGYVEYRLNWWDIAAGGLIVREAGGATGGLGGHRFEDGYVIACAPGLLVEATALFDSAFAATR
jgi:myo-inositol-1(or 4)-monophosphatase